MSTKMVSFHVPQDKDLLAAFGEVALRHEHMNHILKMTIKSLTGVTPSEALAATMYDSSAYLKDQIRKIARKRLGEGRALIKLKAILAECKRLTDKRNGLIHGLWAKELDGDAHVRDGYGNPRPLPTVVELRGLAQEIEKLTARLNSERLEGFLMKALAAKPDTAE